MITQAMITAQHQRAEKPPSRSSHWFIAAPPPQSRRTPPAAAAPASPAPSRQYSPDDLLARLAVPRAIRRSRCSPPPTTRHGAGETGAAARGERPCAEPTTFPLLA